MLKRGMGKGSNEERIRKRVIGWVEVYNFEWHAYWNMDAEMWSEMALGRLETGVTMNV